MLMAMVVKIMQMLQVFVTLAPDATHLLLRHLVLAVLVVEVTQIQPKLLVCLILVKMKRF